MKMSSVVFVVLSAQCASERYIQIAVRSLEWTSQCVVAAWERETDKLSLASEPRPHTELPRILEDQQLAMLKSLDMFLEFQQVKAVMGLGRSTVLGMSTVMQRDGNGNGFSWRSQGYDQAD